MSNCLYGPDGVAIFSLLFVSWRKIQAEIRNFRKREAVFGKRRNRAPLALPYTGDIYSRQNWTLFTKIGKKHWQLASTNGKKREESPFFGQWLKRLHFNKLSEKDSMWAVSCAKRGGLARKMEINKYPTLVSDWTGATKPRVYKKFWEEKRKKRKRQYIYDTYVRK